MARISRGSHAHQTALANDPTKDISANQWNDVGSPAHIETGIFGFPISVSSVSLASNVIVPVDSLTVVKASSGTSDTMSFIDTVGNDDVDILWFTPFSGHTITLTNNAASPPANTGVIVTLSGANKVLDPHIPTLLIRRGNTFYEYSINTSIVNANISASAGIAYSKLNLSGSILNSDISVSASISASKINGTAGVLNGNQTWTGSNTFSGIVTINSVIQSSFGTNNVGFGYEALNSTTGSSNVAMGVQALYSNTSGYNNIAIGFQALYYNISGHSNTVIGYQALYSNISGIINIALGVQALYSNTTGGYQHSTGSAGTLL